MRRVVYGVALIKARRHHTVSILYMLAKLKPRVGGLSLTIRIWLGGLFRQVQLGRRVLAVLHGDSVALSDHEGVGVDRVRPEAPVTSHTQQTGEVVVVVAVEAPEDLPDTVAVLIPEEVDARGRCDGGHAGDAGPDQQEVAVVLHPLLELVHDYSLGDGCKDKPHARREVSLTIARVNPAEKI